MNNYLKLLFLALFVPFIFPLFNRCANVMTPQGGPRDTIPPNMIISDPPNQSLNVESNTFYFEFDERIKVDKLKDQLIITPRIDFDYDTKISKRGVRIVFEEKFKDSTTYTFNFREGIVDVTENNPTLDNKYVFSTGENIDSLMIKGYTTELLTADTLENITVGLYQVNDTITIFNGSPYYFTETDETGFYSLENIKSGSYLIYAFEDGNKNLSLESNSEAYSFIKDTIHLDDNIESLDVSLYTLDLRPIKLQTALPSGHYYDINYNKYITAYDLHPEDTTVEIYSGYAKEHESVRIYNTFSDLDSLLIFITAYDSLSDFKTDTLYVQFKESSRKREPFSIELDPKGGSKIEEEFILTFDFNKPVLTINKDSIFFQYDTTRIADFREDSIWIWNTNKTELSIPVTLDKTRIDTLLAQRQRLAQAKSDSLTQNRQRAEPSAMKQVKRQAGDLRDLQPSIQQGLYLYLGKGAFITVDKDTTEFDTHKYDFVNPEEYGIITCTVNTDHPSYFIQLLDKNNEIAQEVKNVRQFKFNLINPGDYRIRVLIDNNSDGIWSLGNMTMNNEPESVFFFPEVISIRANWELNLDLKF